MKLSNLFMIALLAGTLGVFGCSDDPPATGNGGSGGEGTAGTGGSSGTTNCDYGDCADPGTQRDLCEAAVTVCEATLPDGSDAEKACIAGANTDACGTR